MELSEYKVGDKIQYIGPCARNGEDFGIVTEFDGLYLWAKFGNDVRAESVGMSSSVRLVLPALSVESAIKYLADCGYAVTLTKID